MLIQFEEIDTPDKLKQLSKEQLPEYCLWLRQFLIQKISETGGHFSSNLGVVELTVALHYVYNAPEDKMVWDVGHQSYAHKILTGRKQEFDSIRKWKGISGFPKMSESEYDAFGTAHSSTSISSVLGMAVGDMLQGVDRQHIAIIGDGAMSAGQAFEALNNAASHHTNITIIINDNQIGIDPSQGAFGEYLNQLQENKTNFFDELGYQYFGPYDGHNIHLLTELFENLKNTNTTKIVHLKTRKGKGYLPAEEEQTKWHSTSKFDKLTGKNLSPKKNTLKFQDVFGKHLLHLAELNQKIVAITPAMVSGSSLHYMQQKFPERVFDVGIAEQHAVTFAAGLSCSGVIPVCCIYSTFLQRGYDQLIHDVALQNLHVVFAIDRAGLVGEDGATHHGVFDLAFAQTIPNLIIYCPKDEMELGNCLNEAINHQQITSLIRYPRGYTQNHVLTHDYKVNFDKFYKVSGRNEKNVVISIGTTFLTVENVKLQRVDLNFVHYQLMQVKPLDVDKFKEIFSVAQTVIVMEEGQKIGGIGSSISLLANELNFKGDLVIMAINDSFTPHGSPEELLKEVNLDEQSLILQLEKFK